MSDTNGHITKQDLRDALTEFRQHLLHEVGTSGRADSIRRASHGAVQCVLRKFGGALGCAVVAGGSAGTEDRRRGSEGVKWTKT